ncbi:MAG: class I tRNA ligase family protein [Candidatus Magasanikbacteria bacterium]|nr:class I tRNA ligase family protein [Candidatus Magasanikbacteria bacterium]
MPNWAGSSWYFLRYMDPQNAKNLFTANGFKFRPAIEPTEKDKTYFATFKQVYQDLEKQNIKVWAGNRLLLNGLNRNLWTELRTVCLVAWNDDKAAIANYLVQQGYTLTQSFNQNDLYEKAGVRVEIVPVWKENEEMYSLTYQGAKQPMQARDLPEVLMGHLWGFSFRIISPEYNLAHYEFTEKHESDGQSNQEKIAFLSEWVEKINPNIRYWNQVDWYNGGMEHTVLHLLYSRFWNQFLYDIGVVPTLEPYKKRTSHGMILAKGGEKMSKSKGNVVNPDEMVELYGADALRTYIMFMGPFDQAVEWDTNGLVGVRRFLDKVWNLQEKVSDSAETNKKVVTQLHQTIKKVTDDIASMSFNTPVAKLMELVNAMSTEEQIAKTDYQILMKLVSVFAPHIGEELWSMFDTGGSVALATWPVYDASLAKDSEVTVAVQVNGKVRTELVVSPDIAEAEIKSMALANETIQKWLEGKEPKKVIYVKGRLVSIVL